MWEEKKRGPGSEYSRNRSPPDIAIRKKRGGGGTQQFFNHWAQLGGGGGKGVGNRIACGEEKKEKALSRFRVRKENVGGGGTRNVVFVEKKKKGLRRGDVRGGYIFSQIAWGGRRKKGRKVKKESYPRKCRSRRSARRKKRKRGKGNPLPARKCWSNFEEKRKGGKRVQSWGILCRFPWAKGRAGKTPRSWSLQGTGRRKRRSSVAIRIVFDAVTSRKGGGRGTKVLFYPKLFVSQGIGGGGKGEGKSEDPILLNPQK